MKGHNRSAYPYNLQYTILLFFYPHAGHTDICVGICKLCWSSVNNLMLFSSRGLKRLFRGLALYLGI